MNQDPFGQPVSNPLPGQPQTPAQPQPQFQSTPAAQPQQAPQSLPPVYQQPMAASHPSNTPVSAPVAQPQQQTSTPNPFQPASPQVAPTTRPAPQPQPTNPFLDPAQTPTATNQVAAQPAPAFSAPQQPSPFQPASAAVSHPTQPQPSPFTQTPQSASPFGQAYSASSPSFASSVTPKQKFLRGIFRNRRLIVTLVVGLAVIIGAAWALMTFVFGSVPLQKHEGENYSVLVPKGYEQTDVGSWVMFLKPGEAKETTGSFEMVDRSGVVVSTTSIETLTTSSSREDVIAMYDEAYNEAEIAESGTLAGQTVREFKKNNDTFNGFEARRITFDNYDGDKKITSTSTLIVFGEKNIYAVSVIAYADDKDVQRSAKKILNSLKISE